MEMTFKDKIAIGILYCFMVVYFPLHIVIRKVRYKFGWIPKRKMPPWLTPAISNKELERQKKNGK